MWAPNFDLGTVVTLSIIRREISRKPLLGVGVMTSRNNGASVSSLVKGQIVTDAKPSKLLD
jgi:hypothetical protein